MLRNYLLKRKFRHIEHSDVKYDGVINIHRFNTNNVGDNVSAPYLYFPELSSNRMDILGYREKTDYLQWTNEIAQNNVVVGGGGFLERKGFRHSIDFFLHLAEKGRKVVFWGIGHNDPNMGSYDYYQQKYSHDMSGIKLFGARDINKHEWVPCASCMSSNLDKKYEIKQEIGIIKHHSFDNLQESDHPVIYNDSSFEKVTKFIGESEYIVTDSYHGMYWSILMKKKVLVVPNSTKMFNFRFSVPHTDFSSFQNHLGKAVIHDDALEICRERNTGFSEKVFDYLGL
ncbi:polysaccharide pyruvyl transferase family protein [Saccharicrinis sp. FJH54]|uniref:polysaccharide pyruvyl transferase family protein n=1 Tax=Saccharicrinis sp. FJH54 TaxID=3344665 RepID=UPI0035D4173C